MKDRDKINWAKVRDLRDQYELTLWLGNTLGVLPQNDTIHTIGAIRQEIIEEVGGEDLGGA